MFARTLPTLACLLTLATGPASAQDSSFVNFESGHVRPIALSADGSVLFAVNTPDNRLEVFSIVSGTLIPVGSVPVGLDPVSVRARTNTEVWVVNHLSDSISIVSLTAVSISSSSTSRICSDPLRISARFLLSAD